MTQTAARPGFELLLITDPAAARGLVGSVRAALEGLPPERAARLTVQLRAKALSQQALLEAAIELRAFTKPLGVKLLINGELEVARLSAADGVHLPERGPTVEQARAKLGTPAWIGASCHDPTGLDRAAEAGADYATLSPVYESPGKGEPLGIETFSAWVRAARLPVFALGGITHANAAAVRRAGAGGIAVIGAVFRATDPANAVRALLDAFKS